MSKGLVSYPENDRIRIAQRRVGGRMDGCGYWGALSYLEKRGIYISRASKSEKTTEAMRLMMGLKVNKEQRFKQKQSIAGGRPKRKAKGGVVYSI